MINYYRILQLDDYSEVSVVKRQYRRLAKLYHPDVNKENPEAEEIIKVINKAHATLANPRTKSAYDDLLKNAYLYEKFQQTQSYHDEAAQRRERVRDFIRQKLKEEIKEFEDGLSKFPPFYRYATGILAALTGLQLVYTNWYVNLAHRDFTLIAVGYLLFLTSCAFVFQFYDRQLWYRSQLPRSKRKKPRVNPVLLFVIILVLGPLLTWGLNKYRQYYHLTHYRTVAVGQVVYITGDNWVRYQFRTEDGSRVIKSQFLWNADERIARNEIVYVAYSAADPGISKLLTIDDK